jgi:hypothetical protein
MQKSEQIDPIVLERREFQLWILAISMIGILSIGMATLMYPTIFSRPVTIDSDVARKCFFGFCALSILLVAYLASREIEIRQLRKKLVEGHDRIVRVELEAGADLVKSCPGMSDFQDRLTMEFRRCAHSGQPLSILLFLISGGLPVNEATAANAAAAKGLLSMTRKGDSIYAFYPGSFGIVLAGCDRAVADRVSERFTKSLEEASGSSARFTFETRVISYPEQVRTAREMEQAVRSELPHGVAVKGFQEHALTAGVAAPIVA